MIYAPAACPPGLPKSSPRSEWHATLALFGAGLKRWVWAILAFCVLTTAAGVAARYYMPTKYTATSQLLFDPRGLKIFNNELTSGHIDANAAINFVESQMGVVQSERVLSRVVASECAASKAALEKAGAFAAAPLAHPFTMFCPGEGTESGWDRPLQDLRRVLTVKRGERSFVVDITTVAPSPELAASLASSIVTAYMREDAATRAEAVNKLTGELSGRLEALRTTLEASEAKVEHYRRDKNLIRVGDRLMVEQRLTAATAALNESQSKIDRASARLNQIEAAARNPSALGALGAEADTRALLVLSERRSAVMVELAPLAARAGERHPTLIEVRSRLNEIDRSISTEMRTIRMAARADLARAQSEQDNLSRTVSDVSTKVTQARQSEIELRTLEHEVDANRKLLDSFETRSREAREFGKIDAGNLRIVSLARAPENQKLMPKLILFGVLGLMLGIMMSLAAVAIWTMVASSRRRDPPMQSGGESPTHALQMRAKEFARYRFG